MTQHLMHAWPTLTVAVAALFAFARLASALRSWRPVAVPVHALARNGGDVDPTAILHLAPGPGSIASLAAVPEDTTLTTSDVAMERAMAEELAHIELERREQDAFFADFRAALDDAVAHFKIETEALRRKAKSWHLQANTDCPECFTRAQDGSLIMRAFRVDEPTGEWPVVPAVGTARVPQLASV